MYAELKCKTHYSFLNGASQPEELIAQALDIGLTNLAITDTNGVYAIPKAYWASKNENFKLIVGAELTITDHAPLTLLAKNRAGYGQLCRIITEAHAGKEKGKATFEITNFKNFDLKNIFCLAPLDADFLVLKKLFSTQLFASLSRFQDGHDDRRTLLAKKIEAYHGVRVVACNDVLYHSRHRKPLQDSLVAIREGVCVHDAGYLLEPNSERCLKSPFEMMSLFRDWPEAIKASAEIAEACTFSPSELRYRYPSEWIPKPHSAQSYLEEVSWKGAQTRYNKNIPENVKKQLHYEFALIQQLQFADYFLTIYDIVAFARQKGILCQGRGSAANSVVCYCLGITAIDPVRMNLLFERFVSVERNEPPDIDVDFEHERREEVIQYIYQKYGRDRAAMVSAVVTYQKRSAFRELSKVFGVQVGTLSAKKVIQDFETLSKHSPIPNCRQKIEALAQEMDGFPRHLSIHSGGFTLSADPLIEIVPVEPARMENRTIIQWDKYDLDYLGLLKIDVLSLGMLSALRKTLESVNLELYQIPAEDKKTYEMIGRADTVGTFQVESRAQMNMSGRLKPKTFYEIVVQIAIVRPGPIVGNMVHPYLDRKQKNIQPHYPHPKLKEILSRTLGVPIFQEQLMKIAIELGNFSPGEADELRRAIGAWRSSGSIQKVAERLLLGLKNNGIPDQYAFEILEHMKGFAHYGFPESHAASFALLSYASCYLKCHYPLAFACGLLNSQPMGFYAAHTLIDDAKRHGVEVLPLDPNLSEWDCTLENNKLRLGLRLINGLFQKHADLILSKRPFKSVADFLAKVPLSPEILQRLAMAQFFSSFGLDQRHTLWSILHDRVSLEKNQLDLFSGLQSSSHRQLFQSLDHYEVIKSEYEAYNVSSTGHPMKALREVKPLPSFTTSQARSQRPGTYVETAGLILIRQRPPTANGVCFSVLEDETGFIDLVLFPKIFEKFQSVFLFHCFLIVKGRIEYEGTSVSLIVQSIKPIWEDQASDLKIEPTQYFW